MNPKAPQEQDVEAGPAGAFRIPVAGAQVGERAAPSLVPTVSTGDADRLLPSNEAEEAALPATNLRRVLLAVDGLAATVGWMLGFLLPLALTRPTAELGLWATATAVGTATTLLVMAAQRLYRARSCAVWATEVQRVGRAAALTLGGGAAAALFLDATHVVAPLAMTLLTLVSSLVLGRAAYRAWLSERRRGGYHTRELVLIGANEDALKLQRMLQEQGELGFSISGLVSEPRQAAWAQSLGIPWLGRLDEAEVAMRRVGATGAVAMTNAVDPDQLNALARSLPRAGLHLHLAHGLHGIAHHRLHTVPLGYEPLLYVEPVGLRRRGSVYAKRVMDLTVGGAALLLTAPVLVGAMLAIKLEDGGPALFRQTRVGLNGNPFPILKLRTMRVDAEAHRARLSAHNKRNGGPLFKMADDPRVTRVGRLLRATSLDELPQLVNVLRGQMSLVGPRPALVEEHEAFDATLKQRNDVLPGLTGLWQVEARDNPAFGPYRRLDLYYVENWSIGLDLAVLVATAISVTGRTLSALRPLLPRQRRAVAAARSQVSPAVLE